jgi:serine protease Do
MAGKHGILGRILACVLLAGAPACLVTATPAGAAIDPIDVIDLPALLPRLQPAVVAITVYSRVVPTPPPGQPSLWRERGSGFIVTDTGLVVTARHVVANGLDFTLTLFDGTQIKADLVFEAATLDIALLKARSSEHFPTVKFGHSKSVRVGDPVFAIGNPLGLQNTVTHGIISALDRSLGDTPYDSYIQTDAPINPGNSGGPLFNAKGEVIGINIAIDTRGGGSIGLGFVMPASDAAWVLKQWYHGEKPRPSWIGADVQTLSPDLSAALGYSKQTGVVIAAIDPAGPAAEAKLQSGDVVLKFGDDVPTSSRSVMRSVATSRPGQAVPVEIWRDNKMMTIQVTPRLWPNFQTVAVPPASAQDLGLKIPANLGIAVAPLDKATRGKLKLAADQQGILVTRVAPSTDASLKQLTAGTAILAADNQPVVSVAAFWKHVKSARQQKRPFLLLLTNDGKSASLFALQLGS